MSLCNQTHRLPQGEDISRAGVTFCKRSLDIISAPLSNFTFVTASLVILYLVCMKFDSATFLQVCRLND